MVIGEKHFKKVFEGVSLADLTRPDQSCLKLCIASTKVISRFSKGVVC